MDEPGRRPPVADQLVDLVVAGVGALVSNGLVLFATARYGPGISPDSAVYLSIAQNATTGHGFVSYTGRAIADFPPGFPALLTGVSWVSGTSVVTAARIVNAIALGTIVLEAAILLRRHVASQALRLVGLAGATVAPPLVYVATFAWSEALFVALALGAIICIETAIERPSSSGGLVAAAVLSAAAFTTRYVGVAVGAACAIVLVYGSTLPERARAKQMGVFSSIFVLAAGLVIIRNIVATSTLAGPRAGPHLTFGRQLHLTAVELSGWLVPRGLSEANRIVALGVFLGSVLVIAQMMRRTSLRGRSSALLVFSAAYLVLLEAAAAITSIDPIGPRLLAVLFVPVLVVGFAAIDRLDRYLTPTRAASIAGAIVVLAAAWAVGSIDRGLTNARSVRDFGAEYSSAAWRGSDLARLLRAESLSHGVIYSNNPPAVWATTRLGARCLPPQLTAFCVGLGGDPSDLPSLLAGQGVELAWFAAVGTPPQPVLKGDAFALRRLQSATDGAIYLLAPRS